MAGVTAGSGDSWKAWFRLVLRYVERFMDPIASIFGQMALVCGLTCLGAILYYDALPKDAVWTLKDMVIYYGAFGVLGFTSFFMIMMFWASFTRD